MGREAHPERGVLMEKGRALTQGPRRASWRRWRSATWAWSPTLSGSYWQGLSGRRLSSALQDAALKAHRMRPCYATLGLGSYRHPCSEASIQQVLTGPCRIGVRLEGPGEGTTEPTSATENIRGTQAGHLGCRDAVKVGLGKRSCWEDNEGNSVGGRGNSPCTGSEQKAPAAPLSSEGRGGMMGWTAVPVRGHECVQGPFKQTFSSIAVGVAHVAASGLANVPLKPCFIVWVWACVFFLRRNSWEARRPWTFGEIPEATGLASAGSPTDSRGPGHRATRESWPAAPPGRVTDPPTQASDSGWHDTGLKARVSLQAEPLGVSPTLLGAQLNLARLSPGLSPQLPNLGLHPEHLRGLGPPSMPQSPRQHRAPRCDPAQRWPVTASWTCPRSQAHSLP